MANDILDVAIIGGGVSGVYSAWRLLTDGKMKNVAVFEASERIGGRLLSVPAPKIPSMVAELGGMRILPAVQPLVTNLIQTLNGHLRGSEQIVTYPFPVDQPQNLAYLRGVYLRLEDFTADPERVPYHLTFQEFGKTSGTIVVDAIEQIVPGITNPSLNEEQRQRMAREASFAGVPLYRQGFWNVLMRVMSGEAFQLAVDSGGYDSTLSNWNAADAIPWFLSDFGVDPQYEGFKNGFQQVPLTLAGLVESAKGGSITMNAKLETFLHDQKAGTFELRFQDGSTRRARALILAMPRRSLELISSPLLSDPAVSDLIKSVTPRPLFKLFTTYTSPWWLAAGVQAGRTVTDLPVRQTYYWPLNDGKPALSGRAMLMASYDDGSNISFWDGLRPKRGQGWRPEARNAAELEVFLGEADRENIDPEWRRYHAPLRMVREVERQLQQIHGLGFVPSVVDAAFKDWGDDPFGGGWNNWNIGAKSWEVKEKIVQPLGDKIPFHICGEAYSDAQGWVEGALQTADLMLAKFGLSPLPAKAAKSSKKKR
ncbi:MAG TPA: FAD-dependent oxidoreductase [Thermoanaerobaculia bacterium]|nr:FAD-dependent oxidoreductase [Thermoanaerobaculia bacterium]